MIPLRDSPRTRRFPLVNTAIIILNIYIFLRQLLLTDRELFTFVYTYGLIPERFVSALWAWGFSGRLSATFYPSVFTWQLVAYRQQHALFMGIWR